MIYPHPSPFCLLKSTGCCVDKPMRDPSECHVTFFWPIGKQNFHHSELVAASTTTYITLKDEEDYMRESGVTPQFPLPFPPFYFDTYFYTEKGATSNLLLYANSIIMHLLNLHKIQYIYYNVLLTLLDSTYTYLYVLLYFYLYWLIPFFMHCYDLNRKINNSHLISTFTTSIIYFS